MGRVLAIDYGKKRTGVAVTDPLQLIANGLTTVSTSSVMDFIVSYVRQNMWSGLWWDSRNKPMGKILKIWAG